MDRILPPGTPEGKDAGVAVGVVDPDKPGHNSFMASSRGSPDNKDRADVMAKAVLADRTGAVDGRGQVARSSAVLAR